MILYLASDLLWASKIKGTADALGIPCRPVRNMEMLTARLGEQTPDAPVRGMIFDLEAGPIALELLENLRANSPNTHALVFAPHVEVDLRQQAKAAGATTVMTRGSFANALPEILRSMNSSHLDA